MSKPWGGIRADDKRVEAEERENLAKNPHLAAVPPESLPSLTGYDARSSGPGGGGRVGRGDGSLWGGGGGGRSSHGGFVDRSRVSLHRDSNLPSDALNSFGDAKPRELVLEKGKDWRKAVFQFEHGRPETIKERDLKKEINAIDEERTCLLARLLDKEKELQVLTKKLDDEVRFGQEPSERPGAGRSLEMLPSQLALLDEFSNRKHADTPQSRDDRCSARDFRFFSSKDDRPRSPQR